MWVTGHRAPRVSACLIRCESRCGGLLGITYTVRWATLYHGPPVTLATSERARWLAHHQPKGRCQMRGDGRGEGFARSLRFAWLPPADVSPSSSWPRPPPATNSGCACAGRGESCPACPRFWMPSRRVTRAPLQDRQLEATTAHSTPGTSLHLDSLDRAPARFNRARPCRADAEMHEATNVFDGTPSTPAVSLCYHARTARIL